MAHDYTVLQKARALSTRAERDRGDRGSIDQESGGEKKFGSRRAPGSSSQTRVQLVDDFGRTKLGVSEASQAGRESGDLLTSKRWRSSRLNFVDERVAGEEEGRGVRYRVVCIGTQWTVCGTHTKSVTR
ncbi:hypothetical protein KM043_015377 [Ampulex compressa]|nr:hypothetical protein KM043_015377 [Ampulex compressa]